MRREAQARNPFFPSIPAAPWIPGSLVTLAPRNDGISAVWWRPAQCAPRPGHVSRKQLLFT
jgi:hypothetical protein